MHLLMGNSHVDVGSITLFSSTFSCHCCCIFYTSTINDAQLDQSEYFFSPFLSYSKEGWGVEPNEFTAAIIDDDCY